MHPDKLEEYGFYWSEARLVIAAIALFLGGVPPIWFVISTPSLFGIVRLLLTLAWIISGVVSAYLLYRWNAAGQKVFGAKKGIDVAAFFVNIVSGLNLGIAGLIGTNIGISISSSYGIFVIVGLVYLGSAWQLFSRWNAAGKKLFA